VENKQEGLTAEEDAMVERCFLPEFRRRRASFLESCEWDMVLEQPTKLHRVWWINLSRRPDRRCALEAILKAANLESIAERVDAVDGSTLELKAGPVAAEDAVQQAKEVERVVGNKLTPGAIGLLTTWHGLLVRAESELSGHEAVLILEDDARFVPEFSEALDAVLLDLDAYDAAWQAVQLGYYPGSSKLLPVLSGGQRLRHIVQPLLSFGCVGMLVRGAEFARRLHQVLFPVRAGQQLDSAFSQHSPELRVYASAAPLLGAVLSECGDTDIQRLAMVADMASTNGQGATSTSASAFEAVD
jgi:hypothetical protein